MTKTIDILYSFYNKYGRRWQLLPWLDNNQFAPRGLSNEFLIVVVVWAIEWLLIIEYIIGEWWRENIFFPTKIPLGLILCLGYWVYLWTLSVWRRTQYGKYTRGERKLWAKAITAFWVAELVTLFSFVLVYTWMSWGPSPLVPRIFLLSRKSIIIELVVFSYLVFLAYIMKLTLKWNLWKTQSVLCLLIIIIFSYLLWKDALLLLMRDNLYFNSNARWRNLRRTAVVYSLSNDWWTYHITNIRAPYSMHNDILTAIQTNTKPNFDLSPTLLQYEQNLLLETAPVTQRAYYMFPVLGRVLNYANAYPALSEQYIQTAIYPRRTGFVPKRIGMWQFIVILKMFHHLIVLLWWAFYLFKLNSRKKTSYAIVGVAYFNMYCCLLLAIIVYVLYVFNTWALIFRFRPGVFNWHRWWLWTTHSMNYNMRLLTTLKTSSVSVTFPYLI